ncbi:hypothetical protein STSP1_00535 [Sedimentisphaera salicampi]|uniref:Fibronectin type-III domain-containing protein n=1 Tax=Sedimentisphaera salicampi TaxID=1941349 RepID=A0A1W6LK85_9BACT|nr:hypothetical protein STSP1_00535 [Sedimentisphaera salicampi]
MNSFVLKRIALFFLAAFCWSVFANTFTGTGADDHWNTPSNWSSDVPSMTSNEWANMTVDGTKCVIDNTHLGSEAAEAKGFYVGCYGGDNEFEMTGGELTCDFFDVGRGKDSGTNAYAKITGGEISCTHFNIPNQFDLDPGTNQIIGHVDLHGGVVNASYFNMGDHSDAFGGGIGTMDITQGVLKINGDHRSKINNYAAPDDQGVRWITAFGGDGEIKADYDGMITTVYAVYGSEVGVIDPADKAEGVSVNADVSWEPSDMAISHDIYFGTINPPPFVKNQPLGNEVYDPGELMYGTKYYWKINTVTSLGTNPGHVWSFKTGQVPGAAQVLRPADGQTGVKNNANIIWTPGDGSVSHEVYFGTDLAAVANAADPDVLPGRGSFDVSFYDPGQLAPETTYYLRIDERNSHGVNQSVVWSFTTAATIEGDINFDGAVDTEDLFLLTGRWLDYGCVAPDWCGRADISKSSEVDIFDFALLSANSGPDENEPAYTDYCDMLSQEVQGKKHGFLAGNLNYYIGGFHACWNPTEEETIGFTHPFHHDLRSRGHGMVQDPNTGYGHDFTGWEFYKHTKVAYGSVYVGQRKYENPVPDRMYWRPDKMICEYEVGEVNIREEKFIAKNDVACTIITSDEPVTLEFSGQSFANDATVCTTASCLFDEASNSVHVVEGGVAEVLPDDPQNNEPQPGVMMYDGMSTVISASRDLTDYQQYPLNDTIEGQIGYSFKVSCDSSGTAVVWMMDDDYSNAVTLKDKVLEDPAGAMAAKTKYMNDILNYQIPYFRCSDQQMVDVYYYLWSLYFMYYIDVGEGFEQYAHTQTAVNNFLGMHCYDANFQTAVGAWITDKEAYSYGNILLWSELLHVADFSEGLIPADNMGIAWYSGLWCGPTPHILAAWKIYKHCGDIDFLRQAYDYFKALMWESIPGHWGYEYDAADRLKKMAIELGHPEDVLHWHDIGRLDNVQNFLNDGWETNGVEKFFRAGSDRLDWSGFAYMAMDSFPSEWVEQMSDRWAVNEADGFFRFGSLSTTAFKDWNQQSDVFAFTPDTNWFAITGMYEHHACKNANTCTLGHLKNYNIEWGIPVAPEALDINGDPWGDQYSNFNAGKILLYIEGILGLKYSVLDDSFTVTDHLPMEWDFMETIVPINCDGNVSWTKIRTSRTEDAQGVDKTITVEGNSMHTLHVAPWLEEKDLVSTSEPGYANGQTKGHIDYTFTDTSDVSITLELTESGD